MKRFKMFVLSGWYILLGTTLVSTAADPRRELFFPAPDGYQTMACDLHMHTVFSDGQVWPTVRVNEAWRLGLDAMVITDHIEYQPHSDDIPTNHNRAYEIALDAAQWHGILFPRGSEITRGTPPGHFNAIFLEDQKQLDVKGFEMAIETAMEQKAFVFWNHQAWQGEDSGSWREVHTAIFEKGWLHGMEVANGESYYPSAHRWCLEKGMTMLGNSDIHAPDLKQESTAGSHRTMTLAFVKDWSLEGLKKALFDGRTVVWYGDVLIGRPEMLEDLFTASVRIAPSHHTKNKKRAVYKIANLCDLDLKLERTGAGGPRELVLPARRTTIMDIEIPTPGAAVNLDYKATNLWIAPEEGLPVTLRFPGTAK